MTDTRILLTVTQTPTDMFFKSIKPTDWDAAHYAQLGALVIEHLARNADTEPVEFWHDVKGLLDAHLEAEILKRHQ